MGPKANDSLKNAPQPPDDYALGELISQRVSVKEIHAKYSTK
jgi:hypothetical protein